MKTKTALTELRKLVPNRYVIKATVAQSMATELHTAECELRIIDVRTMRIESFTGNCLEPCLQAASAWAIEQFGTKKV